LNLLFDAHTLIWYYETDQRMSLLAINLIQDPADSVFVSPASHWEIAIKVGTGKLKLAESFEDFVQHAIIDNGFSFLPIEPRHTRLR
jgi:PIN domain nuclease of toxin-antitoxin system